MMRIAVVSAVLLTAAVTLAGCGNARPDQEGFTASDRKTAQAALNSLEKTSIPPTLIHVTQTAAVLPSVCQVHLETRNPTRFRLVATWVPPYVKQLAQTYTWLEVGFSKEGIAADSFHLGNIPGDVPKAQALRALKSHYKDVFVKPSAECQILMNGYLKLLASKDKARGVERNGYVVDPEGVPLTRSGKAYPTNPYSPLVPAPVDVSRGDPDSSVKGDTGALYTMTALGKDSYELYVENTSEIGFINTFQWVPPAGLKVTAITHTSTGRCQLAGGSIACDSTLRPPKCTCNASGGNVTIRFTAKSLPGTAKNHGWVNAKLRIGNMTPVPYVIPSTPDRISSLSDLPLCKPGQRTSEAHPCLSPR
jgi:hypothetical protein